MFQSEANILTYFTSPFVGFYLQESFVLEFVGSTIKPKSLFQLSRTLQSVLNPEDKIIRNNSNLRKYMASSIWVTHTQQIY